MRRLLLGIWVCVPLFLGGCRKAGPSRAPAALQKVKTSDPLTAPYVAGKKNRVYHARHCPYAAELASPVGYETLRDAEASGRMPCEFCAPHKGLAPEKSAPPPQ